MWLAHNQAFGGQTLLYGPRKKSWYRALVTYLGSRFIAALRRVGAQK